MDAFEKIVGRILEKRGYWVKQSVKVDCTPDEKESIGGRSIPTPEIDLVAFKDNECILLEAKSFLDSAGVRLHGVNGTNKKAAKGYKILNNPTFQKLMTKKIIAAFNLPKTVRIKYGLAAGKLHKKEVQEIVEYFNTKSNYIIIQPDQIADELVNLGKGVYINDEVTMTIKILRNQERLIKK